MDSREQLLQTLMQDLQSFQLPERWDEAKKAQVMKGRRGQADIDAGRAAIAENERLYQEGLDKRGALQTQIRALQGEIDTARTKAAQDDPTNQAIQYGKSIGVPVAGYATGHVIGHKFGSALDERAKTRAQGVKTLAEKLRTINKASPASRAQASAVIDTYDKQRLGRSGRGASQFLGPAALFGLSAATQAGADYVDDPYLKEGLNIFASGERAGAGGMMLQQIIDTLRSKSAVDPGDVADIESARRQLNQGGKFSNVQGSLASTEAPAAVAEAKPTPKPGTRQALYAEAKARGLPVTTRTKKAEIEQMLSKALKANKGKATARLGSKVSKAIVPAAVGMGVYDALRSPAEAADGGTAEPMSRGKAAAIGAGAGAGTAAGLAKLRQVVNRVAPMASRAAGAGLSMAVPGAVADMTDVFASPEARNTAARYMPSFMRAGAVEDAYQMAQVPEANPERLGSLMTAAEQDPELAALMRQIIQERLSGPQYP